MIDNDGAPENDLSTDAALYAVSEVVAAWDADGLSLVGMLGIDLPCSTWSSARGRGRGPPRLRDKDFLDGKEFRSSVPRKSAKSG